MNNEHLLAGHAANPNPPINGELANLAGNPKQAYLDISSLTGMHWGPMRTQQTDKPQEAKCKSIFGG